MAFHSRLAVIFMALAVVAMVGCSSGSSTPPDDDGPAANTATVSGRVVRADNTGEALPGSRVSSVGGAVSTLANEQGDFVLRGIPIGQADTGAVDILVETINNANYGTQTVSGVPVTKDATTTTQAQGTFVVIAVLPIALGEPHSISINPTQATVDLHGEIQFIATVTGPAGPLQVQPTWYLTNAAIGTVSPDGLFTATAEGTGQTVAISGSASASAQITVNAPRPPQITSVLVSPKSLGSQGGTVTVSAAVSDGDGLRSPDGVWAELTDPENSSTNHVMALVEGTTLKDGTFRVDIEIDPNLVRHTQDDATRALTYSIRVHAVDNRGDASVSAVQSVEVAGVDEPIPPPSI